MMSDFDMIYQVFGKDSFYRIRPNPDAEPGVGYKYGAVLEWSDDGGDWSGHFFIGPSALKGMAEVFTTIVKEEFNG